MGRRNMANQVLAGSFLLFILASTLKYFYKDLLVVQLLHFMAEAAIVGGVADWFAVTALFRKPLGFPWHTALITRHRSRVISAVADMIENELLSMHSIKERIEKISIVNLFIDWVDNKEGKLFFRNLFTKYSRNALASIDLASHSLYLEEILTSKIIALQVDTPIKNAAKWALEDNKYQKVVTYMVDECITIIENSNTKQFIYQQLLKIQEQKTKSIFEKAVFWFAEQTDSVNLEQVADAIYEELMIFLFATKNTNHALHKWVHDKLLEIVEQPDKQVLWIKMLEDWKKSVLEGMDIRLVVTEFMEIALKSINDSANSHLLRWIYGQSKIYWLKFTQNQQGQVWLEASIKQTLYKLIENEHQLIGVIIHNVLDAFSNEDLNEFIEEKAGDDLQWIRINGCVVGAAVGLILFGFLHYIYDPFVVPVVQRAFS